MTEKFYGWRVVVAAAIWVSLAASQLWAQPLFSVFVGPLRSEMGWPQPEAFQRADRGRACTGCTDVAFSRRGGRSLRRQASHRDYGFVFEVLIFASFYFQDKNIVSFYFRYFLLSLLRARHDACRIRPRHHRLVRSETRVERFGIALSRVVGVGGFVWPMFVQRSIELYGWRIAYLILAATIAGIAIPLMSWLIKEDPIAVGQVADGVVDDTPTPAVAQISGMTLNEALRAPIFWLMFGTFF
jgi:hypothetical protein